MFCETCQCVFTEAEWALCDGCPMCDFDEYDEGGES
jgi:hypothetical protein